MKEEVDEVEIELQRTHDADLVDRGRVRRALTRRHLLDLLRVVHRKTGEDQNASERTDEVESGTVHEDIDDARDDETPKRHAAN